jgi:hypothetical protein
LSRIPFSGFFVFFVDFAFITDRFLIIY